MIPPPVDGFACRWIGDSVTIHSDGNVSCGLDDPFAQRSFGNVRDSDLRTIFANPEYERLRDKLAAGHKCRDCGLYEPLAGQPASAAHGAQRPALPTTLIVEPTITCNLRCAQPACIPNNAKGVQTRQMAMLPLEVFKTVVDELAATLRHVYFFNYGDPFVHRDAEAMLAYLREKAPQAKIVTSTNGIPLMKRHRAEAVALAQPDHMTFTIGGMRQESYARYHAGGRLADALAGLRNVAEARLAHGLDRPDITWRYLLFRWNDGLDEVSDALRLAAELGVRISLYLTETPRGSASWRFSPGSPLYQSHSRHIDAALGYSCGGPDRDGLYGVEDFPGLGAGRWAAYRARLLCAPKRGRIKVALSTNRLEKPTSVTVKLPWGHLSVGLKPGRWTNVVLEVPQSFKDDVVDVRVTTKDYWFPAEHIGSDDLRCLGFIVKWPAAEVGRLDAISAKWTRLTLVRTHEPLDGWDPFLPLGTQAAARYGAFK